VSGGHCILAVAHSSDRFSRLGQTRDDSPGEAFDKLARWLALDTHPDVGQKVGGAAVELLARKGDLTRYPFPPIMARRKCCNFSFSGLKTSAHTLITRIAMEENWRGDCPLPGCEDIAASFQEAVCRHLLTRTHRALLYTQQFFPEVRHLVVSGGVASNQYLRTMLRPLLHHYDIALHCPPPHLCTDNGVMIAWSVKPFL
jgi:N6-L-threonylcarbamoyladenine synthase